MIFSPSSVGVPMPEEKTSESEPIFPETEEKDQPSGSFKEGLVDFYYKSVPLFNVNFAWTVMSLPVVTLFPALGGLYAASLELARGNQAGWGEVWEGFKAHWWLSLRWGLLVLFGDFILLGNIWFYLNITQTWSVFALVAVIFLLVLWIAINQFSFPLLLLQEEKKILLAIRNGYVIVMRRPLSALKILGLNLLITIVSIFLPPLWLFISMALMTTLQSREVLKAVSGIHEKDARRDAAQAHREGKAPSSESSGEPEE
jgi:uncharacterized membrane protein YesL